MSTTALEKLARTVEELQRQVAVLTERIAQMEGPIVETAVEPPPPAAASGALHEAAPDDEPAIPQDVLLALSAAVAAYLGERQHIRAVRLIGSTRWSQEGRVSIQASHRLTKG
ncbi:MAG TPA: hypothetical protein VES20_06630 [Bryobacteraceae bacterium]|nr:hypothetical protein [Bryobacteraceae bacterium]